MNFRKMYRKILILIVFLSSCTFVLNFWPSNNTHIETDFENKKVDLPSKNAMCIVLTAEQTIASRAVAVWKTW
jgi:hypothetical protein